MRSLRQRCEANDKGSRLSCSIFQFSIGGAVVCMMQYAKGQMVMQSLPDQGKHHNRWRLQVVTNYLNRLWI